jgi:hypothetical protein
MGPCSGPARALAETALPVARYCLGVQSTSTARLPVALAQKKAPDRETSVRADGNGKHCRLPQSGPRSREQRLQEPEIETSGPPYHPVYGHLVEILVSVGDFRPKRLLAVEEGEAKEGGSHENRQLFIPGDAFELSWNKYPAPGDRLHYDY